MAPELAATLESGGSEPDWHDRDAIIDHIVEGERPFARPGHFDAPRLRTLAGTAFDRSNDLAGA